MTALRDTIVAELVKRGKACRESNARQSDALTTAVLVAKASAYEHAAEIAGAEFAAAGNDTASAPRPSLYNTPAAMLARIVAEHPRCIAMSPSLAFDVSERPPICGMTQREAVRAWLFGRSVRADALTGGVTREGEGIAVAYGTLTLGDLSIPVVMVTIIVDGARFMVAIEAVR